MNFSAEKASRKWPCGRTSAAMVTAAVLLMFCAQPAAAQRSGQGLWSDPFGKKPPRLRGALSAALVPLPRPRPAEAPAAGPEKPEAASQALARPEKPDEPATPASACRLALTEAIAIAPSIPDIHGPGGCGGEDLVRLEAVVLPDKHQVSVKPAAILRCTMALAIADWIRADIVPLAQGLGSEITGLDNFDSFECRGRNRVAGAPLSEHGRANALDVRALKLADGQ